MNKYPFPHGIDPLWDNANLVLDIANKKWSKHKVNKSDICNDPKCNCKNVEPNFRSWLHLEEDMKNQMALINGLGEELAVLIAKTPSEARCKALAQTKLQECMLWIKEGITKNTE